MSIGSFLSQIMTPWTSRSTVPSAWDVYSQSYEQEQKNKQAQDQIEEIRRRNLAQEGLESEKIKGSNEYYKTQAATHKEDVEQRHHDRLEKDFALAHQAMVNAKTPEARRLAQQALASAGAALGYSAIEEPSDAPQAQPLAPVPDKPQAAYPNPPKPSPSFMGALGAAISGGPAGPGHGQYSSPDSMPDLSPMPWEQLGAPKPEKPVGTVSEKPTGPTKFVLRDKNGASVYEWDEPLLHHKNTEALKDVAKAAVGGALTPEEEKAVDAAAREVAPFLDQLGPKAAMEEMRKRTEMSIGQFKKRGVGGGGGPGPGVPGKAELQRLKIVQDEENHLIEKHLGIEKAADLSKMDQALNNMDAALTAGGGMNQVIAMVEQVKAANGRAAAQQEFKAIQGASGAMSSLETLANHYLDPQGNISPETVRQMRAYIVEMKKAIQADRDRIAGELGQEFESSEPLKKMMKPDEIAAMHTRIQGYGGNRPKAATDEERKKKALDAARKALGQ